MNDRVPHTDDELLSAYFDGEATPEERARVEALQKWFPAIDAELESYSELSQLLKSLPRETAPAEIRAAAVQAAERSTLLAAETKPRRSWRYLREVAFCLASAAAGILVTVAWQRGATEQTRGPALTVTAPAKPGSMAEHAVDFRARSENDRQPTRFAVHSGDDFDSLNGVNPRGDLSRLTESTRPTSSNGSVPAPTPMGTAAFAPAASALDRESGIEAIQNPVNASIPLGDVVNFFADVPENRIANFEVYYDNAERGANSFQEILLKNGVKVAPELDDKIVSKSGENAENFGNLKKQRDSKVPALYVDAPTEPVAISLEELSQQSGLIGVRLRPTLELPIEVQRNAQPGNQTQPVDVSKLLMAYNENLRYELLNDLDGDAVSAVDAVKQEPGKSMAQGMSQKEAKDRYNTSRSGSNRNADRRANLAQQQEAITPLQVQQSMESNSLRLSLPTANSVSRGYNIEAKPANQALLAETQRAKLDDNQLQRRMTNPYGNAVNVRMLVVFQETEQAAAATNPAAPPTSGPASVKHAAPAPK